MQGFGECYVREGVYSLRLRDGELGRSRIRMTDQAKFDRRTLGQGHG